MSKLLETFEGWEAFDDGGNASDCGAVHLAVDAVDGGKRFLWSVNWHNQFPATGHAADLVTAKADAIRCAEKVLAESAEMLTELRRRATAPCKCGAIARKDGRCIGCNAEIPS